MFIYSHVEGSTWEYLIVKTFVVLRKAGRNWVTGLPTRQQPLWDEHAAFIDALFDKGAIMLGGPFADGSGALLIVYAEDESEALAMLRNDPWVKHDIQGDDSAKEWTVFLDSREKHTG